MSLVIVPLAGPDFYTERFGVRPLYPVGNSTLIEVVLSGRSWMPPIMEGLGQLVFILRDTGRPTFKMLAFIAERFPLASTVVLGGLTSGAPLSALAGIAMAKRHDAPVIVDLADITFDLAWNPELYFQLNTSVDAIVPYFASQDPKFSYLTLDGPRVLAAREKQVISDNASAGVYFFRDVATYLRATSYCLLHQENCKVGAALFVCPSVNGLISAERHVHAVPVYNANPISRIFH
jgi:hypothetical protein